MTIEAVGSIGELIAAIATVATLFYLAMQIRHSVEATRATSQQALLDTYHDSTWDLGRDMELARLVGVGLVAFDSLDDREKTAFSLVLLRYVGNVEKGLRLRAAGLIDQETLDSVASNLVAALKAPGGAEWWKVAVSFVAPIVVEYLDRRLSDPDDHVIPWNEQIPFWARWATESQDPAPDDEPAT